MLICFVFIFIHVLENVYALLLVSVWFVSLFWCCLIACFVLVRMWILFKGTFWYRNMSWLTMQCRPIFSVKGVRKLFGMYLGRWSLLSWGHNWISALCLQSANLLGRKRKHLKSIKIIQKYLVTRVVVAVITWLPITTEVVNPVQAMCNWYSIMWFYSEYSGFLHKHNWLRG